MSAAPAMAAVLPLLWLPLALAGLPEPPSVEHQPMLCTVPGRPFTLCATVTDDGEVAKVRIHFRRSGEKFYSFVDMSFGGIRFCGTLPAPLEGKTRTIEYYVEGIDDQFDSSRTSTHLISVQPAGECEFPPVEKDPSRTSSITVYATSRKQGKDLPDGFDRTGVTFVPAAGR